MSRSAHYPEAANTLRRHLVGSRDAEGVRLIARAAQACGKDETILRDWITGKATLPAGALRPLARALGRDFIEDIIGADEMGWVIVERPDIEPEVGDVRGCALKMMKEAGDAAGAVESIMADGVVTDSDLATWHKERAELVRKLEAVNMLIEETHKERGRCLPVRRAVVTA